MKKADAKEPSQPLAEVFGHLVNDQTSKAARYRSLRLCPFNNKVPNCTKDKAKNPLGVCSIYYCSSPVITCPIRFREEWIITDDAASFFFGKDATWSSLIEVRLNDANGKTAGNIDVVLVAYDDAGKVYDFGALEIQAVYISGNVRDPFELYIKDPIGNSSMDWSSQPNYPRPDFFSSLCERLVPQLLFKSSIIHSWKKKTAVALSKNFLDTLPPLKRINKNEADIAWLVYDLQLVNHCGQERYVLKKVEEFYTQFETSMQSITTPSPGRIDDFIKILQDKLDEDLETAPVNGIIEMVF
jgi:hypothetical protein